MEQSLNLVAADRPRARIAFARLLQAIGWAGLAGLALFAAAAVIAQAAWTKRVEVAVMRDRVRASLPAPTPPASVTAAPAQALVKLPKHDDVALLLTRIERAVTDNGLPWTAGDYRLVPATDHQAAALEVRCAFKAPYPKLRAMLAQVIGSAPAVTFREMSLSRASVDSPDVDARLAIVVFLADGEAQSGLPAGAR